jgi:hypothetical protein
VVLGGDVESLRRRRWLSLESLDEDTSVVRVRGGIAADRAEQLWDAIEGALELAVGGRVVVDLALVSGFDIGSIQELADAAMAAVRRHADLCAVVKPGSALDYHVRCRGLMHQLPLYSSLSAAVAATTEGMGRSLVRRGELDDFCPPLAHG